MAKRLNWEKRTAEKRAQASRRVFKPRAKKMVPDHIQKLLEYCEERTKGSEEYGLVLSMASQAARFGELSSKQLYVLERIASGGSYYSYLKEKHLDL